MLCNNAVQQTVPQQNSEHHPTTTGTMCAIINNWLSLQNLPVDDNDILTAELGTGMCCIIQHCALHCAGVSKNTRE